jgi:DNA-binding SARP family transcriptional activator
MQESFHERRYRGQLATLVKDMGVEQRQLEAYRPLDESEPEPLSPSPETVSRHSKEKV